MADKYLRLALDSDRAIKSLELMQTWDLTEEKARAVRKHEFKTKPAKLNAKKLQDLEEII